MNEKRLLLFFFLILITSDLLGSTYYIANSGNDSNTKIQARSSSTPWKTISKAAQEVQASDTIIVADGEYNEGEILFANSGTPTKWITLTNAPGSNPRISKSDNLRAIFIYECSYVHINGFTLHGYDNDGISIYGSDYIICTNIHAYDNGNVGINVIDSDHILIQDCLFHHNGWNPSSGWGDGLSINNHFATGKTSIVRRNICYANWQKNGRHGDGSGFTLDAAGTRGLHIVANNIFFNNGGDGLVACNTSNMKIVHNIFFRNGSDPEDNTKVELMLANDEASNTILKNNIIHSRQNGWAIYRHEGTDNADILNNCIYGDIGINTMIYWFGNTTLKNWLNDRAPETLALEARFVADKHDDGFNTFHGKQWLDMDIHDYDFNLQSSSQCIDAGTFLTATTRTTSGTKVEVEDAAFFTDGFGKIDGDYIRIGSNNLVKIVQIDYENNIITIESNISWNKGDSVHLPFYGSAPDIGAHEFNPEMSPTGIITPSQPSPVRAEPIKITLITSKVVIKNPTPLFFNENDSSFTVIQLTGTVPGTSFSGRFNIDNNVSEGVGYFTLQENSLVDEFGKTGNVITQGNFLRIDKTTPAIPKNVKLK